VDVDEKKENPLTSPFGKAANPENLPGKAPGKRKTGLAYRMLCDESEIFGRNL